MGIISTPSDAAPPTTADRPGDLSSALPADNCLDVLLGPDKLAGSAQRRSKTAVLQHGSIIIERRYEQQPAAAIDSSVKITADELGQKLVDSLIKITKLNYTNGSWQDEELNRADQMIDKYTSVEWTKRR